MRILENTPTAMKAVCLKIICLESSCPLKTGLLYPIFAIWSFHEHRGNAIKPKLSSTCLKYSNSHLKGIQKPVFYLE